MQNRLSWTDIKHLFSGQWIEIADYEWDWNSSYPAHARVINSTQHRADLLSRSVNAGTVPDSAILFVGGADFLLEQEPTAVAL